MRNFKLGQGIKEFIKGLSVERKQYLGLMEIGAGTCEAFIEPEPHVLFLPLWGHMVTDYLWKLLVPLFLPPDCFLCLLFSFHMAKIAPTDST